MQVQINCPKLIKSWFNPERSGLDPVIDLYLLLATKIRVNPRDLREIFRERFLPQIAQH